MNSEERARLQLALEERVKQNELYRKEKFESSEQYKYDPPPTGKNSHACWECREGEGFYRCKICTFLYCKFCMRKLYQCRSCYYEDIHSSQEEEIIV